MNKIIVYGATKERAFEKLQTILDDMRYGDIEQVKKSKDNFTIELKNGDYYTVASAADSARGHKWQYAFIDRLISEEVLNCVVFPKFIPKDKDGNLERSVNIKDRYKWY